MTESLEGFYNVTGRVKEVKNSLGKKCRDVAHKSLSIHLSLGRGLLRLKDMSSPSPVQRKRTTFLGDFDSFLCALTYIEKVVPPPFLNDL